MRVVIDGFSMSLEQGTGIASYARNLSLALRALGCEVGVLTGRDMRMPRQRELDEVMFFDAARISRAKSLPRRIVEAHPFRSELRARELNLSGLVVTQNYADRLPYFTRIYNVSRLFDIANSRFTLLRAPTVVHIDPTPDVAHWTIPLPIRVANAKNVYTIHDLIPLRLPYMTLDRKAVFFDLCKWIVGAGDLICTVSDQTRSDVLAAYQVEPEKVVTTYQSVEPDPRSMRLPDTEVRDYVNSKYDLGYREYFLYYGAIEPKKNLSRIVNAFMAGSFADSLVIAGSTGWLNDREMQLIKSSADTLAKRAKDMGFGSGPAAVGENAIEGGGLETAPGGPKSRQRPKKLVHLEYLSREDLTMIVRGARAVVFASLYEGFGLPILEAMMCGTPVITSSTGATAEVAGTAALLVDPYDTHAIRHAMQALATDGDLWRELRDRGRQQAGRFSSLEYQERLAAAYATIGAAP